MPKSKFSLHPSPLSLYFMGADDFGYPAAAILERLHTDEHYSIQGVMTPPDSAVDHYAKANNLNRWRESKKALQDGHVDFIVVASYGEILSQKVLDHPKYGSFNIHPSLLPKYRGPSPIPSALLNGDSLTGVCVMKMVAKMDAGPIYGIAEVAIKKEHNGENLRQEMAKIGGELLAHTLLGVAEGSIEGKEQDDSSASYCIKIEKTSGAIDWQIEDADEIHRKWRAYQPWPGVFTTFKGKRIKLLKGYPKQNPVTHPGLVKQLSNGEVAIEAAQNAFVIERIQMEGKKEMPILDFIRGQRNFLGSTLGQ